MPVPLNVNIAASGSHCVGLCTDGTVVACGENEAGRCNVQGWSDMIDVACGLYYTVGLRVDGTLQIATQKDCGLKYLRGLTDVMALYGEASSLYLLMKNGDVIRASAHGSWDEKPIRKKVFNSLEELRQDLIVEPPKDPKEVQKILKKIENRMEQRRNKGNCQHCGGQFKGLLTKKCVECDTKKDY